MCNKFSSIAVDMGEFLLYNYNSIRANKIIKIER